MGLKGYRLWVMRQLDSNVQSPTETAAQGSDPRYTARHAWASPPDDDNERPPDPLPFFFAPALPPPPPLLLPPPPPPPPPTALLLPPLGRAASNTYSITGRPFNSVERDHVVALQVDAFVKKQTLKTRKITFLFRRKG
jgi:hypothetical protein